MYKMYLRKKKEFVLFHIFDNEEDLLQREELYNVKEYHYGIDLIVLMNDIPLTDYEIMDLLCNY